MCGFHSAMERLLIERAEKKVEESLRTMEGVVKSISIFLYKRIEGLGVHRLTQVQRQVLIEKRAWAQAY